MKSICTVHEDKTYDEAALFCKSNGLKLFVGSNAEEKTALTSYSDVQYPFGAFWVSGKSATGCSVVTNTKKVNYASDQIACATKTYFHCEYQSELVLSWFNRLKNESFFSDPTPSLVVATEAVESK